MWKIMLSNAHFDGMRETIVGKCNWQKKTIWINDKFIHTKRNDKFHAGRVKDIFSLTMEQRFVMVLNHEVFHAAYHEKINNINAMLAMTMFPIFLLFLTDILKWLIMISIMVFAFGAIMVSFYIIEEMLAYKHGENYTNIDGRMFARLS